MMKEFSLGCGTGEKNEFAIDADLSSNLLFFIHIGNRCGIIADTNKSYSGLRSLKFFYFRGEFIDYSFGDQVAVDEFHMRLIVALFLE